MKERNIFTQIQKVREETKKHILKNQDLLKLLAIQSDKALSSPSIKNTEALIDTNIYFKPKVLEETIGGVKNVLMVNFSVIGNYERIEYLDIKLNFRILVHNKLYELNNGEARIYKIAEELANSFDEARGSWLGKCYLSSLYDLEVPTEYQGIEISFTITDLR